MNIATCAYPAKVRECGAEYAANPGASRIEYLDDAASYMRDGVDGMGDLTTEERKLCRKLFQEGVDAERALNN